MSDIRPIAVFYTPLKHPRDLEPSGDRQIARTLMDALRGCGFAPVLASRLLTWRRTFDPSEAERLERRAAIVADTIIRRYRRRLEPGRPRLWMSYQNYYRCPDLLGPVTATALGIPYVLVDTAISTRSRGTPFRPWASAARLAARRADLIFAMSRRDLPRLAALRGTRFAESRLLLLPPAVDVSRFDVSDTRRAEQRAALARHVASPDGPVVLCVAMMRATDKLDSYRLLAAGLRRLVSESPRQPWRLVVVGDGPARPDVVAAFAPLPAERIAFLGALEPEAMAPVYLGADLLAFPGLGEALGLVYLEAGAAGLPVLACHGPGPAAMVAPDGAVLTDATPEAYATGLARLLDDPLARRRMGAAGRRLVTAEHTVDALQRRLKEGLARLSSP